MNYDRFLTRVWDIKEKKMFFQPLNIWFFNQSKSNYLQDYLSANIDVHQENKDEIKKLDNSKVHFFNFNERYIPMQSTGLRDKNDKLIYEGDILATQNHKYLVFWDVKCAGFWLQRFDKEHETTLDDMRPKEIEIIGNKFQNPELMEETKK